MTTDRRVALSGPATDVIGPAAKTVRLPAQARANQTAWRRTGGRAFACGVTGFHSKWPFAGDRRERPAAIPHY